MTYLVAAAALILLSTTSTLAQTKSTTHAKSSSTTQRTTPQATPTPLPSPAGAEVPMIREEKPVVLGRTQDEIERDEKKDSKAESLVNGLGVGYSLSPIGLPVLVKHGPTLFWPADNEWQLELAYMSGGISLNRFGVDIGSADESLITLNARRFGSGRNFNWIIGLSRQSYKATIGSDLLSSVSSMQSSLDIVKTTTIGLQLGLGNRWQFSNWAIGADWAVLNIPFMTTQSSAPALDYVTDERAKSRIDDGVKVLRSLPSLVLARITIGYVF